MARREPPTLTIPLEKRMEKEDEKAQEFKPQL